MIYDAHAANKKTTAQGIPVEKKSYLHKATSRTLIPTHLAPVRKATSRVVTTTFARRTPVNPPAPKS